MPVSPINVPPIKIKETRESSTPIPRNIKPLTHPPPPEIPLHFLISAACLNPCFSSFTLLSSISETSYTPSTFNENPPAKLSVEARPFFRDLTEMPPTKRSFNNVGRKRRYFQRLYNGETPTQQLINLIQWGSSTVRASHTFVGFN